MSQTSLPDWATMGDNPSSSIPSDEEISPAPETSPTMRKRKGSPNASISRRKRPKAVHSATEPAPAMHASGSGGKAKGKRRRRSLGSDSDNGSLDFDLSAEFAAASSQKIASTSTSVLASKPAGKVKGARKSLGSTGPKTMRISKPAFLSASASSQTYARKKTPDVNGHSLEISDNDDFPTPRRPVAQPTKPINRDDIIVIDSDSEASPPPSKSRPTGPLSSKSNAKLPSASAASHSRPLDPPGFRMVDNVFELISSDEEESMPPVRSSDSGGPRSPVHAALLPSASANRARRSTSSTDELDIAKQPPSLAALSPLKLSTPPPSPPRVDMDMDIDFGPPLSQPPPEPSSSGLRHISPLQEMSPVGSPPFFATPEPVISAPIQATTESGKSPASSVAQGSKLFGLPTRLSSLASKAAQAPVSADIVSPNAVPPGSPIRNDMASIAVSPAQNSPVRISPAEISTHVPDPSVLTPEPVKSSPSTIIPPPIHWPFQPQIRTEPSVPPPPAPNALDLGDRHHPPGSLFGLILKRPSKTRDVSILATSSNPSTSSFRPLQTSTSAAALSDPTTVNKEPISALSGVRTNTVVASTPLDAVSGGWSIGKKPVTAPQSEEVRIPVTSGLYRAPEGQTLLDVINRAYKPAPMHIDLTLDDSDEELVVDVPASVRRNAKLFDEFLSSDNEGKEEIDQSAGLGHNALASRIDHSPARPNLLQNTQAEGIASAVAPSAKPRTNLDGIRSLIRRHQGQVKKATNNAMHGSNVTAVTSMSPIALSAALPTSDATAQPTSPPSTSTKPVGGPSIVNALVSDVTALSMPHDTKDEEMEDLPITDGPLPVVPEPGSIRNGDILVAPAPSLPGDEDVSEGDLNDIRFPRSRKQLMPLADALSLDSEDVEFDLMYPESEGVAIGSPLKNEIARRSSSAPPSPPPLSTRTSSRLSSRSAGSFSGDPIATVDNNIDDDIDIEVYEPRSDGLAVDSPYITWRSVRRETRERPPKFLKAKDLPHTLQDYLNALPAIRKTDGARIIFEAAIRESTANDEPDAPPIEFHNKYDDEVTPPWEFHYTNKMWHGEGVPGPDMKSLQGCDCEGRCDPKSKTCLCVKKQSKYLDRTGFVYNDKGRLIDALHYPIFECNDFCGCGEECQNRVVQHGRKCIVNIVKTKDKGWGVFAGPKRITAGTYVGIYAGELLTEAVGQERGLKYDIFGRTYLFNIDGYHLQQEDPNWEVSYVVDAYHAGNFTRFLNHSCEPNCMVTLCYINEGDKEKPLVTIFAQQDIEPWGELSFSYSGITDEDIAVANRSDEGAVYAQCLCGAPGCRGVMFK